MSIQSIQVYRSKVEKIIQYGGSHNESALRNPLRETCSVPETFKVTPRLIARKDQGLIGVDTITTLKGVPASAWNYRLGTYTALEWILERYKEKTPRDPTIREKFNTWLH